jgi:hypothetical protein
VHDHGNVPGGGEGGHIAEGAIGGAERAPADLDDEGATQVW